MHRRGLGLALAAALGLAGAAAAQELPKTPEAALKFEAADALPRTAFYDAPADLKGAKAGSLIRQEAFDGYTLPKGVRAVRILYHSRSAEGRDVPASAVVLIPPGSPPAGGWPVIAWAHGTSGVARQCAPSLMKDVYYGEEGLFPMLRAGYAVVATDYAGLGTAGPHQYISKLAQARDVAYSIPAARGAVPSLGRRWVAVGHSQGGLAAWGVAEQARALHDPGYLGAVAVAPGVSLKVGLGARPATSETSFYLDYVAFGIRARTPSFKPADMLQGAALDRFEDLSTKGCFYYGYAAVQGDKAPVALKPGWRETPGARKFFAENEVGAPIAGALLVVAGEADRTVPIEGVRAAVADACRRGVKLGFRTYPGLDHDPVMEKSTADFLVWIGDRFAGRSAANDCARAAPAPSKG